MLKAMRNNTRVVVWTIVIAFALWGAGSVVTGTQMMSPYAGEIGGKKVKVREFEKRKKLLKLLLPLETSDLPDEVLTVEAFKNIALSQEASQRGLKTPDVEVRSTVENLLGRPMIGLDMEGYTRWTKSVLNESPRDFEETLRQALLAQQLMNQLLKEKGIQEPDAAAKLTDAEKKKAEETNRELTSKALHDFYTQARIKIYLKTTDAR